MIAFFQWRLQHPTIFSSHDRELNELIEDRQNYLKREKKEGQLITEITNKECNFPKSIYKNYQYIGPDVKPNYIYTFDQIGIQDPFPFENDWKEDMPQIDDIPLPKDGIQVYPQKRLSSPHYSPRLIFLPRKELIVKMMRACICVEDTSELWFNRNEFYAFES